MIETVSRFSAPTRIIAGIGAAGLIGEQLRPLAAGRIALVCDRGVAEAGLLQVLIAPLPGELLVECGPVSPDPTIPEAEECSALARHAGCDAVLAIGGGSALGVGKAVAIRLRNDAPITDYEGRDRAPHPPAPCLAIPTTAGSGSEVSNALVLENPEAERALIVRGHGYEPDAAILDGNLLRSLPREPMRNAALDALSHALEALWARGASAFTDALAVQAAETITGVLPAALASRRPEDLQRLIEASAMANLACGNTGLGLVHALDSAPGVPLAHGYQNGVFLPHVAAFNMPMLRPEARQQVRRLEELYGELDFIPRFQPGELDAARVELVVAAARGHQFQRNNIREASEADIRHIVRLAADRSVVDRGRALNPVDR